jgi:hypothetical protein
MSDRMAHSKWFGNARPVVVAKWLVVEFEKCLKAAWHLAPFEALRMLEQQVK